MPDLLINNNSIHYQDEGRGPVILFGHSYLWNCDMWREQIVVLSQDFRCIAPDLWGHGKSDAVNETPTIQSLANDHWELMQQLHIDRFHIVGLSVGGMWGTQMALDHPEAVEKLVLMDTFIGEEPEQSRAQYLQMLDIVEQVQNIPEPMIQQLLQIFLAQETLENNAAIVETFTQILKTVPVEKISTIASLGRSIFSRDDFMRRLAELKIPTLVMTGEFDVPRPVQETRQMAAMISNSECHIIAKAGHISAMEQPVQVNKLLKDFFKK